MAVTFHVRNFLAKTCSGLGRGNGCILTRNIQTLQENATEKSVVEEQTWQSDLGRLFAVVHLSGIQRKVTTQDIIAVQSPIMADVGERIRLNKVLLVGGKDFSLVGRPVLGADVVRVEATVLEKTLSQPKTCFWYHRRRNHKRFFLRQDDLIVLLINSIEVGKMPVDAS